jgi:hypothetical protein
MPSMSALPSLEQLKRQAKELLRAVRSGDPRALSRMNAHLPADHLPPLHQYSKVRLAQALFVIAREHGFASWPRLKASMSTTRTQTALEQPGKMTGSSVHAPAPSGNRGVTSRALVLAELAIELADLAGRKDAITLASRFSRLPRRDILGAARSGAAPVGAPTLGEWVERLRTAQCGARGRLGPRGDQPGTGGQAAPSRRAALRIVVGRGAGAAGDGIADQT